MAEMRSLCRNEKRELKVLAEKIMRIYTDVYLK